MPADGQPEIRIRRIHDLAAGNLRAEAGALRRMRLVGAVSADRQRMEMVDVAGARRRQLVLAAGAAELWMGRIDDLAAGDHIPHAGTFRRMGHMRPEAADRKVVIVDRHRRRGLWSRTRVPDGRGNRRSPHPTRYADGLLSHARTPQGGTAPRTYDGPKSGRRQTSSFARRPRAQTGGNLRRGDRDEPSPGAAQSCEDCCQSL